MSTEEIPPWLKEQLARFDQAQQNLQTILLQKQQVEADLAETERALVELRKVGVDDAVYKSAGPILIKVSRDETIKELDERKELSNTRAIVLAKQESRIRESVKEMQGKISEAIRGRTPPTGS